MTYEELAAQVKQLQAQDKLPRRPTREQRADWAYGNAVIENPDVTIEMAEAAAARAPDPALPAPTVAHSAPSHPHLPPAPPRA